jgi:hypothetical protein
VHVHVHAPTHCEDSRSCSRKYLEPFQSYGSSKNPNQAKNLIFLEIGLLQCTKLQEFQFYGVLRTSNIQNTNFHHQKFSNGTPSSGDP